MCFKKISIGYQKHVFILFTKIKVHEKINMHYSSKVQREHRLSITGTT